MEVIQKLDLTKTYPEYYKADKKPKIVNLEPYHYLTVQGVSSPDHPDFMEAIEHLYALAYGIKFLCKAKELDFVIPKMEGIWWVTGDTPFEETPKEEWHWKIMFRMPDFVGESEVNEVLNSLIEKDKLPKDHKLIFEEIHEGLSAQILHIGSYDEEAPTLDILNDFLKQEGFETAGKHHEIYLSDPRKTPEEKLKTILRYPIR